MATPEPAPPDWLEVGKIVAVQGLKGEVRVYPDSDFPERFTQPGQRWLQRSRQTNQPLTPPEPVQLLSGRYLEGKGLYVVKFSGIDSREQAENLRGAVLLVLASDRPKLKPGEYHLQDLIGLQVFNQQTQELVGVVKGLVVAGNDLLEVEPVTPTDSPILIPLVPEIVPLVDLAQRRLEVNPLQGLF
jgi:16S rRNA processing protein RimM